MKTSLPSLKIIITASDMSHVKVGGLFLVERALLCVQEFVQSYQPPHPQVFVFWQSHDLAKKIDFKNHPRLKDFSFTQIFQTDKNVTQTLLNESEKILVVNDNQIFSRQSLKAIFQQHQDTLLFQRESVHSETPELWTELNQHAEKSFTALEPLAAPVFFTTLNNLTQKTKIEKDLFKTLKKPTDGYTSVLINRPISTWLSRYLVKTNITPSQWSGIVLMFVPLLCVLLAQGSRWSVFAGAFLYNLISILDGCDGEIARIKFLESKRGEWIDTIADQVGNLSFVFFLGLGLSSGNYQSSLLFSPDVYFFQGIGVTTAVLGTLLLVYKHSQGKLNTFGNTLVENSGQTGRFKQIFAFVAKFLKRDSYIAIFTIVALLGYAEWILHFLTFGITLHLLALLGVFDTSTKCQETKADMKSK